MRIGLLHPGQMGSSLGAAARSAGARVLWASEGRSAATRARAEADGLEDAGSLAALAEASEWILSVCPPEFACEQADAVFARGFRGRYVDANAIQPASARAIATAATRAGASFVDGGIIGPPARSTSTGPPARATGRTLLCLSGEGADAVAAAFADTAVTTRVLGDEVGAASALKMAYAAYTKGHSALLLAVRALARAEDVEDALLECGAASHPRLAATAEAPAAGTGPQAWRFGAEMREIAATFAAAGLPDGFHRAAAETFDRMADLKDAGDVDLDAVLARLLARGD